MKYVNKAPRRGFTLLETLVALAILAISLAAIMRVSSGETLHTEALRLRLLADWVAQNQLNIHAARGDFPEVGITTGNETQAGINFNWEETVQGTPNPAFLRVEINVYSPDDPKHVLRHLVGFLPKQRRAR